VIRYGTTHDRRPHRTTRSSSQSAPSPQIVGARFATRSAQKRLRSKGYGRPSKVRLRTSGPLSSARIAMCLHGGVAYERITSTLDRRP
jgi:hypothetical protein